MDSASAEQFPQVMERIFHASGYFMLCAGALLLLAMFYGVSVRRRLNTLLKMLEQSDEEPLAKSVSIGHTLLCKDQMSPMLVLVSVTALVLVIVGFRNAMVGWW